jgi:DnaJ domain
MMSERIALKTAIDLMHVPSQVRRVRSEPLPDGVLTLLRIAADDDGAVGAASALTGRPPQIARQAATFFIEQILFAPDANSYQVLGLSPQASAVELRRHLALLLRWLHPDLDPRGERTIFIKRVTAAWNSLKTPERRAAYDEQLRQVKEQVRDKSHARANGAKSRSGHRNGGKRFVSPHKRANGRDAALYGARKPGFFQRVFSALFHRPAQ